MNAETARRAKRNLEQVVEKERKIRAELYKDRPTEFSKLSRSEQEEVNEYYLLKFLKEASRAHKDIDLDNPGEYDERLAFRMERYKDIICYQAIQ